MATATASHNMLHDPFSPHHTHYSPSDTSALVELLATDHLVDSHRPNSAVTDLLNDLLAVDLEFACANVRDHQNVATAPALKDEKDLLLDLWSTDQRVDGAKGGTSAEARRSVTLHDPYRKEAHTAVEHFAGVYAADRTRSEEQQLRDNVVMMHLLAMDESVDDSKRYREFLRSDDCALIGELHAVDREVGRARRRALLVEDLQALLDVDHLVDGVLKADRPGRDGGKRSIFSVKEKYTAKVTSGYSR